MESVARGITTTQQAPHDDIIEFVERYRRSTNQRPISQHTKDAFDCVSEWLSKSDGDIILDACCGVGESTAIIANQHPDMRVIGVDKSAARLAKHAHYSAGGDNYRVVRADVIDFWRLARAENWQLTKHFILYPNPYPKPAQVKKRWHASSSLPDIVALGGELTIRSNWQIYLQEWSIALAYYGKSSVINDIDNSAAITPFERKYQAAGQPCWQLKATLA